MLPKYQIGDFVRDSVSQKRVRITDVVLQAYLGIDPFYVYHTTAGPDENYPHGHRLENEIGAQDLIGPLVPR